MSQLSAAEAGSDDVLQTADVPSDALNLCLAHSFLTPIHENEM